MEEFWIIYLGLWRWFSQELCSVRRSLPRPSFLPTLIFVLLLLGVGTLGCTMSNSFWTLLAARAVTGAGGAGILTLSSIITTGMFPSLWLPHLTRLISSCSLKPADLISLRERGYYQGLMSSSLVPYDSLLLPRRRSDDLCVSSNSGRLWLRSCRWWTYRWNAE